MASGSRSIRCGGDDIVAVLAVVIALLALLMAWRGMRKWRARPSGRRSVSRHGTHRQPSAPAPMPRSALPSRGGRPVMRPPAQGAPVVASLVVTPPNPEVSSPLCTPSHRSADYQIPPSAWAAPQATPSHVRAQATRLRFELPYRTSPSMARSGKPVTNQVTTTPAYTGPGQCQPDNLSVLTCRNTT